jgi:hypothetical protein
MRRLIALSWLCLGCTLAFTTPAASSSAQPLGTNEMRIETASVVPDDEPLVSMRSDGGAWISTGSALLSVDAAGREQARVELGLLGLGNATHVAIDPYDGSAWVTTDAPLLLHFAADGPLMFGAGLGAPASALAVDLAQRAWVVAGSGLLEVAADGRTLGRRPLQSSDGEDVRALLVDGFRDRLWLATSNGLYDAPTEGEAVSWHRTLRGNVQGVALDERSGRGIALVDDGLLPFDDAGASPWLPRLTERDERVLSVVHDANETAFVIETTEATLRVTTDGRLLERSVVPERPARGGTPLRVDPTLALVRPPSGGAIVDTVTEIVLRAGARCNGKACDVPSDYLQRMQVRARIGATSVGPAAVDASGRVALPLAPATRAGDVHLSATVTDIFGHAAKLDSAHWTVVAAAPFEATTDVASRNDGTNDKAANKAPTVSLTFPANGAVFTAGSDIVLAANAGDSDGSITKVEFYRGTTLVGTATGSPYRVIWTQVPAGSYALTAKAYDDRKASASSPTISITVVNNQAPIVALTSPTPGTFAAIGTTITLAADARDADGAVASVEFLDGSNSIGTSSRPPYQFAWTASTPGTHSISAKATDDRGGVARSSTVDVTVGGLPVVVMTAPDACSNVDGPVDVILAADATSASGKIASVEFFDNGSSVASVVTPPWRAVLPRAGVGAHSIAARATDGRGLTAVSRPSSFSVRAQNQPPAVTLTSPADGARFAFGRAVSLQASASDADGSISAVEFRLNGSGGPLLARVTHAPYVTEWSNVAAGSYAVVAVAYDDRSASSTSAPVRVIVDPNATPSVTLTAPLANARLISNNDVTVAADAADSDGSVARVEFYAGAMLLGSSMSAPYATVWKPVTPGAYALTAKAIDNAGGVSTSAPVAVNVVANAPPTVALTVTSADHDLFAPATIVLAADARDSDGSIARVEFYAGTTMVARADTAPYRFVWDAVQAGTYVLTAMAIDDAGAATTSTPVSISVATGPSISIDPGLSGATIDDDNVLIRGFVSAPENAAVTVNGSVTHIDDLGRFNANEVALLPGSNTVTVEVTTQAGQSARQSIVVNSTAAGAFVMHASPTEGLESLQVTFTIENPANTPFKQMLFDLDNDGYPNLILTPAQFVDGKTTVTATYPEGTWLAVLKAYDDHDRVIYSTSRSIVVRIPQILQGKLRAIYDGMLTRLRAGNIAGAMSAFTGSAYDKYNAIFTQLQPSLAEIVDQLGEVKDVTFDGELAELTLARNTPDGVRLFMIYMLRSEDGIWRIAGM